MSKLTILDLSTQEHLSTAEMSKIGGGMGCDAGQVVAGVYMATAKILLALGDYKGSAEALGKSEGIITATCS